MQLDAVATVILAAGRSSRFGGDKLLHPFNGKPLAAHIAETISMLPFGKRYAVVPPDNDGRANLFARHGIEVVAVRKSAVSLSESLHRGVEAASATGASGLLICLADMPLVSAGHLEKLVLALDSAAFPVVCTAGVDRPMPPAAFARHTWPRLLRTEGDRGAREILMGAFVIACQRGELIDIDTPADLY